MPVGVEDGRIPDEAITASSSASGKYLPIKGRLNLPPSGGKFLGQLDRIMLISGYRYMKSHDTLQKLFMN